MKKIRYIIPLVLSSIFKVSAQVDSLHYDLSEIQRRTLPQKPSEVYTGRDFIYEEPIEEPNILMRFFSWLFAKLMELMNKIFDLDLQAKSPTGREMLWFVLTILLIVLIVIGIIFFYKKFSSNLERNDSKNISAEEAEKNIHEVNFDQLIKNAVNEKDYRLAIRFYYLKILKTLSDKELIEYEYQKTNYEYYYEINNPELKEVFKEISFVFDYCWYGDHLAQENDFIIAQSKFNDIQNLISKL